MDKGKEDYSYRSKRSVRPIQESDELALSNPVEWVKLKRFDPKHRDIWCKYYNDCLDYVIQQEWKGWSCYRCVLRKKVRVGLMLWPFDSFYAKVYKKKEAK